MIVLRVIHIVMILMSVFFLGFSIYTRVTGTGTEQERSAFVLFLVLGVVGLLMSFLFRFIVKFGKEHLND